MKYTKGTPTIIGPIEKVNEGARVPYMVKTFDCHWFTESEIDAIVIKPKRNIDHLIELWDGGKEYESASFMADFVNGNGSTTKMMQTLMKPYTESRKYPVLTPEELKAVKWLVEGGFTQIYIACAQYAYVRDYKGSSIWIERLSLPVFSCGFAWVTDEPINLKELLEAQEDV